MNIKNKLKSKGTTMLAVVMALALALVLGGCGAQNTSTSFAGGSGTEADPYQIATADQLALVRDNLSASYVLTANIDLQGAAWLPIGSFVPGDDGETPDLAAAFTGTFDGGGYTVGNYSVDAAYCAGLFAVVANGTVKDIALENVTVSGNAMGAAAIGYAWNSTVENVDLGGESSITGTVSDGAAPNMVAGIVGAGMDSALIGCDVTGTTLVMETVDATAITENIHDAGLVGGGLEGCTLADCTASDSSITADGAYSFGIGGLSGCAMSAPSVTGCSVSDATVTVGDNAYLVGGLVGYTGLSDGETTEISTCSADNITLKVGESSSRIGGLVGGGFYIEAYAAYFPVPTSFTLADCTSNGIITAPNGSSLGAIAGNVYTSALTNCSNTVTINGVQGNLFGEDSFLTALTGIYQQLFEGATFNAEYDSYWNDYCAAIVGADAAGDTAAMMKASIGASIYGQEAADAYAAAPESMAFDCGFINGVASFTFDGSTIKGMDSTGAQLFSHSYEYIGLAPLGADEGIENFVGYAYKSTDENSGEFSYFILMPDTPASTYHIEFRYGSDLDALKLYDSGDYAYWLAAGIPVNASQTQIEQVIALFCTENMDYSSRTPESVEQLADFVGTWDCEVSDYPELVGYGITGMYFTVDAEGNGQTFAQMSGSEEYMVTDSYLAFAYENATSGSIYAAHNLESGETQCSHYAITETDGKTVLTITTLDGEQIVYTKR